jgi:membrane dipeptidase
MPSTASLERARRVLARTPLIDGHNDLAWVIRERGGQVSDYDLRTRTSGCTDLPRLSAGVVAAQFWAVYLPCARAHAGTAAAFRAEIDLLREVFAAYPERLVQAFSADEVLAARAEGRIASFIGVEGGQAIEGSLDELRRLRALGVRYLTLTHNCTTDWADSALDAPRHGGLSARGVEIVHEMNRLGVLVDLAHTSPACMHRALDVSAAPVIWSHACARALVDHPRNVPDDVLERVAGNGGIVMVAFVTGFVSARQAEWDRMELEARAGRSEEEMRSWRAENAMPAATLADVADHVDHIRSLAGIDHIGVGSDFDGFARHTKGLEDVSRFPDLFAELADRGWSDEDLAKLAGDNILRVLRAADRVAAG